MAAEKTKQQAAAATIAASKVAEKKIDADLAAKKLSNEKNDAIFATNKYTLIILQALFIIKFVWLLKESD